MHPRRPCANWRVNWTGLRPAFHQNKLRLVGDPADGKLRLETRDHQGTVWKSAEAILAQCHVIRPKPALS